jgi:hypothetical protein
MCGVNVSGCVWLVLLLMGVGVFFASGLYGKFLYYRGKTDFDADDAAFIWKNSNTFFARDPLFYVCGAIGVLIYVLLMFLAYHIIMSPCLCFSYMTKPKKKKKKTKKNKRGYESV